MKYLTDEQFDELMEHLQGTSKTQTVGMIDCGFQGMKLTAEQIRFRDENYKKCRRCKTWIGITDCCDCC